MTQATSAILCGVLALASASATCAQQPQAAQLQTSPAIADAKECAPRVDDYPSAAKRAEAVGTTELRFSVDERGKLLGAEVIRSAGGTREHKMLDRFAMDTLRQCRFLPGKDANGLAVGGLIDLDFVWKPDGSIVYDFTPLKSLIGKRFWYRPVTDADVRLTFIGELKSETGLFIESYIKTQDSIDIKVRLDDGATAILKISKSMFGSPSGVDIPFVYGRRENYVPTREYLYPGPPSEVIAAEEVAFAARTSAALQVENSRRSSSFQLSSGDVKIFDFIAMGRTTIDEVGKIAKKLKIGSGQVEYEYYSDAKLDRLLFAEFELDGAAFEGVFLDEVIVVLRVAGDIEKSRVRALRASFNNKYKKQKTTSRQNTINGMRYSYTYEHWTAHGGPFVVDIKESKQVVTNVGACRAHVAELRAITSGMSGPGSASMAASIDREEIACNPASVIDATYNLRYRYIPGFDAAFNLVKEADRQSEKTKKDAEAKKLGKY